MGQVSKKAPWDQRLAEGLARRSWEAANDPAARGRRPSWRAQIRSPYYWCAVLAYGSAAVVWFATSPGWPHAIGAVLYVAALLAGALSLRDARAIESRHGTTDDA